VTTQYPDIMHGDVGADFQESDILESVRADLFITVTKTHDCSVMFTSKVKQLYA